MAAVIFYEKPGCLNNTRQKAMLEALGHELRTRNLLTQRWSVEHLRSFFAQQPVAAWFNLSAPRVKSGEVDPHDVNETEALNLMLRDPLLIRRPLIEVDGRRMAGLEPCELLRGLGVAFESEQDLQSCPRTNLALGCAASEMTDV